MVDQRELRLDRLAEPRQIGILPGGAPLELQVGDQPAQAQHRLGAARRAVRVLERRVDGTDGRRDRVGVGALEEQEASDRAGVRAVRGPRG